LLSSPASFIVDWKWRKVVANYYATTQIIIEENMKAIFIISITSLLLMACTNSGPMKIGKDYYNISVRVPFSGAPGARSDALESATNFCQSKGKELLLITQNSNECMLRGGCGEAEITFMCLNEDDPRYSEERQMRPDRGISTIEIR
jgi:hypothetical protein